MTLLLPIDISLFQGRASLLKYVPYLQLVAVKEEEGRPLPVQATAASGCIGGGQQVQGDLLPYQLGPFHRAPAPSIGMTYLMSRVNHL